MLITRILLFTCLLSLISCGEKQEENTESSDPKIEAKQIVDSLMNKQEQAWSNADLEGFMSSYWKSDSLVFVGKNGASYGWQTTLDNYKKGYQSAEEMGKLTFTNEIVKQIDKRTIFVVGQWHLTREESIGDIGGYYSLVWQLIDGKWVIIADHSS